MVVKGLLKQTGINVEQALSGKEGIELGFLLGGFITAYVKTHGADETARFEAADLIKPVKAHLFGNCIGSVCEIFDGDAPHNGRGCYAQAWSVGELLRCLYEDIKIL